MQTLWQDVRYGARILLKRPSFTLMTTAIMAIGIAVSTMIFSLAEALLIHPFDFPRASRLVMIHETDVSQGLMTGTVAPGNFFDWQKQSQSFEVMTAIANGTFDLTGAGEPERLNGNMVTAQFFATLEVQPALGRTFQAGEEEPGRERVIVLRHSFWQRRFSADPGAIGQSIQLDGKNYTIIGVMPGAFSFPSGPEQFWIPLALNAQRKAERARHFLRVAGRLKSGVTLEQASAEIGVLAERLRQFHPEMNAGRSAYVMDLTRYYTRVPRQILSVLMVAAGLVLLIACANAANLLLGRGVARKKEIALRMALGAGRWRLWRQLLVESLLLALCSSLPGITLAQWLISLFTNAIPAADTSSIPGWENIGLNWTVLMFAVVMAVLTGLLAGMIPALKLSRFNLNEQLQQGNKGGVSGTSRNFAQRALVISEIALSLTLLVCAGLLARSLLLIGQAHSSFRPENILSWSIQLDAEKYPEARQRAFYEQLLDRVQHLPGVISAGAVSVLPFSYSSENASFEIVGQPPFNPDDKPVLEIHAASPDYFKTIGLTLYQGRSFAEQDNEKSAAVGLINEAAARRFFSDQSFERVIGQHLVLDGEQNRPVEIIGITASTRNGDNNPLPDTLPIIYLPYAQYSLSAMSLVAHTSGRPTDLIAAVRHEVLALDAELPIAEVRTMQQIVEERSATPRLIARVTGVFAGVSLLLALLGIYAVMSYAVSARVNEIGIRMALGAQTRDVFRLIIRQSVGLTAIGLLIGMPIAAFFSRALSSLLFGITPTDPLTYAGVSTLFLLVALLACWIPARRATKVDPMIALRM